MERRLRLTPMTRHLACEAIMAAPDGDYVTIKSPTRSLDQNARMWAMLTDVSRQIKWPVNGRLETLEPEEWKDVFSSSLHQEARIAQGVRGGIVMLGKRTSTMTVGQMSELIEFMSAFGAEHGVLWSEQINVPEWVR